MSHIRWNTVRHARGSVGEEGEETDELYEDARLADELAQQVYDRRVELGLSQAQLAERAGMKQPQISRLEGGGTVPTLSLLRRLAKALEVELHVGFAPSEEPSTPTRAQSALQAQVIGVLSALHGAGTIRLEEPALREQFALFRSRTSTGLDVGTLGALVQLKAIDIINRQMGAPLEQQGGAIAALEQIRSVVDAAVNEAEDEVRRLEAAG